MAMSGGGAQTKGTPMARRRSGAPGQAAQSRRAKVDALRAHQQRADRRRRILLVGAVALLAAVALLTTVVFTRDQSTPAAFRPASPAGTGLPPWPAPDDPHPGIEAAGLVSNPME